ncbi:MAG: methyltransferase domain-containing protein [Methanocalculus sp.]|uniref:class I SAM-dependent methyltransferase n=1 Tax=Methanocalculus sp. TaxID=2004547 RepID=UPI002726E9BA|nr:methyltransferase domain-containing protein [Methanocalculus sp.]MDO9539771.1 methyltransferase domain-containing protein [Methanocalculus sp.]
MNETEIESIAQSSLPLMNPVTPEMIRQAGDLARLPKKAVVYDIGCGNATLLALWHRAFGITGIGIEQRHESVIRARQACASAGKKITIIEGDAAVWKPESPADCTAAIGSAFIFGGSVESLPHLASITKPGGTIVLGDRYWQTDRVPPEFAVQWSEIPTEYGLIAAARDFGLTLNGVIRASPADHDTYESAIWRNCSDWLTANPDHPEREEMEEYLCRIQDEYLVYGREAFGWACWIFVKGE